MATSGDDSPTASRSFSRLWNRLSFASPAAAPLTSTDHPDPFRSTSTLVSSISEVSTGGRNTDHGASTAEGPPAPAASASRTAGVIAAGPSTPTPRSRNSAARASELTTSSHDTSLPASSISNVSGSGAGLTSLSVGQSGQGVGAEPIITRRDLATPASAHTANTVGSGGGSNVAHTLGTSSPWGKLKSLPRWNSSNRTGAAVGEGPSTSAATSGVYRTTGAYPSSSASTSPTTNGSIARSGRDEVFDMLDGTDSEGPAPLDGEDMFVVDDEACYVADLDGKLDFLSSLPHEVSLYILLHLDYRTLLLSTMLVSRHWHSLANDNLLWRDLFHREPTWRLREDALRMGRSGPVEDWEDDDGNIREGVPTSPTLKRIGSQTGGVSSSPSKRASSGREDAGAVAFASSSGLGSGSSSGAGKIGKKLTDIMADFSGLSLGGQSGSGGGAPGSRGESCAAGTSSTNTSATTTQNLSTPFSSTSPPTSPRLGNSPHSFTPSRRPSQPLLHNSPSTPPTATAPLFLNWPKLYKDRYLLQRRWEKAGPMTSVLKGHTDSVYCLQFDADKVVSGSRDRTIRIWDIHTLALLKTLKGHEGSILCLQYDEDILVSGSSDCRILIWDLKGEAGTGKGKWEVKQTLLGHNMGVLDLCFDKQWIVSCSKDTTIKVWHRDTGKLSRTLSGHSGPVNAVQLLNNRIISASGDSLLKMWDAETGDILRVFSGHARGLACVQYSPSGRLIATGSNDKTVKVWDAETGVCLLTLEGHTDLVRSLAFDEVRKRLVSASYDRTLRVWDLDTGLSLSRFKAHTSLVFDVTFSASKILSCSHDQKIMILDFGYGLDVSMFI